MNAYLKLYIAVLDEFPDYMTPTLVAHSILGAHLQMQHNELYNTWLNESFRKCVIKVNRKEFEKIIALGDTYIGHENNTLNGIDSCVIPLPVYSDNIPKVLRFAKLWTPNEL